jgi:hypothetical protein
MSVDLLSRQSIKERSGLLSRESAFARQNYNSRKEDCATQSLRAMPNSSAAFQAAEEFGRVYDFLSGKTAIRFDNRDVSKSKDT